MEEKTNWEKICEARDAAKEQYERLREAEKEYNRLSEEGIRTKEELIWYIEYIRKFYVGCENSARITGNEVLYAEAIGIQREFTNLLDKIADADAADLMGFYERKTDGTENMDVV